MASIEKFLKNLKIFLLFNMKKEKILVVEDDFANAVSALQAFSEYKVKIVDNYESFLEQLEKFKPDVVLSDAEIKVSKESREKKDFRDEIAEECEKRSIPYVFVTGAPKKEDHHKTEVNIIKKDKEGYKVVKRYDMKEKNEEVWLEAYKLLES